MSYFEIGIITKAQGIRGEIRVLPTTDDPARFEKLIGGEIKIIKNGNETALKLINARMQKNIVILEFENITDRNAAEKLIGAVICIPDELALPLDEGEYYVRDLIGLRAETESGEALGELTRVLHTGANDVYVITPHGEKSFMVPAVKDVVKKVDLSDGKIILHLLEGMRELTI
jgi:16S rRNA processing protein RimM